MSLIVVKENTELLEKVISLWRKHSDTLGFFPDGAFAEHARKGCILAATENEHLNGYVLYRRTSGLNIALVHLCVAQEARGKGLARLLLEELCRKEADCYEIRARCRRDYDAAQAWPKLGFSAKGEAPGRGKNRASLTDWRKIIKPLPLLEAMRDDCGDAVRVVLDACVFFDLDESSEGREESKALLADWLTPFIDLCVVKETFNEVDRNECPEERQRQRARLDDFTCLEPTREEQPLVAQVRKHLGGNKHSMASDIRQVAEAIAVDATFFVTRDEKILDAADEIYGEFGLRVVRPYEVIIHFDELRREQAYRPQRFAGTALQQSKAGDLDEIVALFCAGPGGATSRKQTRGRLRDRLANVEQVESHCIRNDDSLLAAYVLDRSVPGLLQVPFFGTLLTGLGPTLARHLAEYFIHLAVREDRCLVSVDPSSQATAEALRESFYVQDGETWQRVVLRTIADAQGTVRALSGVSLRFPDAAPLVGTIASALVGTERERLLAEQALWPAKVTGLPLPCFIVPIQPRWASHLFDQGLARNLLFGPPTELFFKTENAYYRSATHHKMLKAPARVLWYVSEDSHYPEAMSVRASSQIEEIFIGPAKEVFRRFRRLGVYEWRDIAEMVDEPNEEIMAFRFGRTEIFQQPLPWGDLKKTLLRFTGKAPPLASPLSVTEACFLDVYSRGMQ